MIRTLIKRFLFLIVLLVSLASLSSCDSEPPTLMKATTQFESDEKRDQHIAYMRKNHMDALKHKRDETMYKGIRTEEHSLKACIDCHVPETYNGKVLRHTDQEHFCTTCHTYVAAQLNCFECHVDYPNKVEVSVISTNPKSTVFHSNLINTQDNNELMDLAFKYATNDDQIKNRQKGGGMSFSSNDLSKFNIDTTVNPIKSEISHKTKIVSDE